MVVMQDRGIGIPTIPPLSPFVSPRELLADALPLLDPASRISVTDAAEMFIRIPVGGKWQRFSRMDAPYIVEPSDITQSRRFKGVVFVGPAQSGKTTLLSTVALHPVMCGPDPVRIVHMDRKSADQWVEEKLDPMIQNSPEIWARLGRSRDDSTFSRKRFKGMRITIGYPVASFLSSTTQRFVLLTDYDHMDQVLGPKDAPEGSPWGMAGERIIQYMSRGCVLAESTPAFPITDPLWRVGPSAPHELPPVAGGIVRIYNEGTRGRWYWECMNCGELFEPHFKLLKYRADLEPGEAGADAEMHCPHPNCGELFAHRHKVELNRRALTGHGGWLHESTVLNDKGERQLVRINDSTIRPTAFASYSLNGAAAAFASWADIVSKYESARRQLETFGDDTELSRVFYTTRGEPYLPPSDEDEDGLTVAMLRDHVIDLPRATAPAWARFITTTVDVQGAYFAVLVTAWGAQGERVMIDRFDLIAPPTHAPDAGTRRLDPARYAEDADVLLELAERVYPLQGETWGLRPHTVTVDFNGPAGWSDNAEAFWRARRKAGDGSRWFLSMGRGRFDQRDRVWYEAPERASNGKKTRSIKLLNMATDRLKDSVLAALGRFADSAAGASHVPRWMPEEFLAELLGEQRTAKGYVKRKGVLRNETLDLSVQALATAEHKGINRMNWEAPPGWALLSSDNDNAVVLTRPEADRVPAASVAPKPPAKGIKYLRR